MQGLKKRWLPLMAAAALPWTAPAHADALQDATMQPYLSEALVYTIQDHKRISHGGVGAYLAGGVPLSEHFGVELGIFYNDFNAHNPTGSRWDSWGGRVNALYFFDRNPLFEPFLQIGAGAIRNHSQDLHRQSGGLLGTAGVGSMTYFPLWGVPVGIRFDAIFEFERVNKDHFTGSRNSFGSPYNLPRDNFREGAVDIGIIVPLGGIAKPLPPPPPPPPQPAPVPPPQEVQPPAPPPAEARKENPNVKFEDVHFAFDKYDLTDYAKTSLDSDVNTINRLAGEYPNLQVDVSGHTDWVGSAAYNLGLSERRANVVRDYLERKGVQAGRIHTFAYGLTRPIAPNTTKEGRALNRRAEVRTHDQ